MAELLLTTTEAAWTTSELWSSGTVYSANAPVRMGLERFDTDWGYYYDYYSARFKFNQTINTITQLSQIRLTNLQREANSTYYSMSSSSGGCTLYVSTSASGLGTKFSEWSIPDGTTAPQTIAVTNQDINAFKTAIGTSSNWYIIIIYRAVDRSYLCKNPLSVQATLTYVPTTAKINVGGSWKGAEPWVNVAGSWKKGIMWTNVGGTWKQGT